MREALGAVADLLVDLPRALLSSWRARGALGADFAAYGRRLGVRLLLRGYRGWRSLLLMPVSSTRYWEFPFVWSAIPPAAQQCLDVGSPRLLSLRVADQLGPSVLMLNPDQADAKESGRLASALGLRVSIQPAPVESLTQSGFDCIWSISVVEHIAGEAGDSDAMRRMFDALGPGGRLIVTIPADRTYWIEYRERDEYGLQRGPGPYFFQRFYDLKAVRSRLIGAIGIEPSRIEWYGEVSPGTFHEYVADWRAKGYRVTLSDPERMLFGYAVFPSWESMPGVGVCGLVFDKPK